MLPDATPIFGVEPCEALLASPFRPRLVDGRWPVVLPLGVLEYHGEHMAVGMDTLAVTGILEILERDANLVILPPFYYGAAGYAVEPPERTGTLHVDAEALLPVAKAMFTGLLRIGFRNIHVVIHHQTENFTVGMPTDLAFKFAARQAIFAFLEAERGEGWWGAESMADYYARQSAGDPLRRCLYRIPVDEFAEGVRDRQWQARLHYRKRCGAASQIGAD